MRLILSFFLFRDDFIILRVITGYFLCKNRTNCYKYHNSDVITFFIEFQVISIIESDTKQKYSRKKVK